MYDVNSAATDLFPWPAAGDVVVPSGLRR